MCFDFVYAIRQEFEALCDEITLAELFGNPEVWATMRRIEGILA